MDNAHIYRVFTLLEDQNSSLSTSHLVTRGAHPITEPHPLWKNQAQWKWFFRDIGKQSCILGLLPFIEVAKHLKQTPVVEGYNFSRDKQDTTELFQKKSGLVTKWALEPSKSTKREIIELLPPAKHHLKYDLQISCNPPDRTAVAFINWLVLIVVENRHFQNHVFRAFACIGRMGYADWFVSSVFKQNVSQHYQRKLEPEIDD